MTLAPDVATDLLSRIRLENLNVYRASPQRLREDVGQENQIAQDYRGRVIYELLQNADDAMADVDAGAASVRFVLTDQELWVGNSGRPLDEADVRGLCGISASSKVAAGQKRRATIGHKGMGFKSVLEITDAPEVYSTTFSFRFGPEEALRAVRCLVDDGLVPPVSRAPVARFPWPVDFVPAEWAEMRAAGMQSAFRFPLRSNFALEQQAVADALISLPVTTLLFLKHFRRVEFAVRCGGKQFDTAWSVTRERLSGGRDGPATNGFETGVYRVILRPDQGDAQEFLLAHDGDIVIGEHRSGLDEFSWEGVEYTEVSVATHLDDGHAVPLVPGWRKLHVFLPSGEPCPYHLLISGAFSSNLSRQEIRIEPDKRNYNRFLLRQAARLLRDELIPSLRQQGATTGEVLRLLDRGVEPGHPAGSDAAQALYEEVRATLQDLPLIPQEAGPALVPPRCVLPPLVQDRQMGCDFRSVLPAHHTFGGRGFPIAELCGSDTARVLADHGAYALAPLEAAAALAGTDPARSWARDDLDRGVMVDPVLTVLERLSEGLGPTERGDFAEAVRHHPLCPVSIDDNGAVHRIATEGLEVFYPPRSLSGEVPLDGLCFLARDICWGALTPKERNIELRQQMEAWQALFGVREFKFPDVMRASVLPALELERSAAGERAREALRNTDRLAAICQLAGRTPNRNTPLPYERLGSNRALFNLSRLDVPCRKRGDDRIIWMPAYRVYFGDDWVGDNSIEWVLFIGDEVGEVMPDIYLLLEPKEFVGLLDRYRYLRDAATSGHGEVGEDEVSLDEDEEAALDADDRTRWFEFFSWLGVNSALRPVHFHDVEDRASGWLRTEGLRRPEGWAFQKVPDDVWSSFVAGVRRTLEENPQRYGSTVPYFYRLHDLEHLVALLGPASHEKTTQLGRALYEHLARNWGTLERYARVQVAQIPEGKWPNMRTKPPRAYDEELIEAGDDFWVRRLQQGWFCPTGHGPRPAPLVWLPTLEVQRRFGYRAGPGTWRYLVPTLDVDPAATRGKARSFAQTLRMREELTPANFTVEDARIVLERLRALYAGSCNAGADLRSELREVIRPAYRNVLELLSSRERPDESRGLGKPPLADAPLLAQNGDGVLRFAPAREVFYADRRETRNRLERDEEIWTFMIEASPGARAPLAQVFGMRTLEDVLEWLPAPGESALSQEDLAQFRAGLRELAPFLLARVGAERVDERLVRLDTRQLRRFVDLLEPVTHLRLSCMLDGRAVAVAADQRLAHVELGDEGPIQALVVWGEHPWPPTEEEAEALATALCETLGTGYFESFLALIQAGSAGARERLLRRAGAPLDVDEKRALLQGDAPVDEPSVHGEAGDVKTAAPDSSEEEPARPPDAVDGSTHDGALRRTPLFALDELRLDGQPVILAGPGAPPAPDGRDRKDGAALRGGPHPGGYGGHTDLDVLERLGMGVALTYERNRLLKAGLTAEILDLAVDVDQPEALVFDTSTPAAIDRARTLSPRFDTMMRRLHKEFGVSLEWPGFDILSLGPRLEKVPDRLIELKSSGVDARMQEMSWNEWKTAAGPLRPHFYLYLVGNLRSDLRGSVPFLRAVQDPFGQLASEVHVERGTARKVHLAVHSFHEAEHLDLSVVLP